MTARRPPTRPAARPPSRVALAALLAVGQFVAAVGYPLARPAKAAEGAVAACGGGACGCASSHDTAADCGCAPTGGLGLPGSGCCAAPAPKPVAKPARGCGACGRPVGDCCCSGGADDPPPACDSPGSSCCHDSAPRTTSHACCAAPAVAEKPAPEREDRPRWVFAWVLKSCKGPGPAGLLGELPAMLSPVTVRPLSPPALTGAAVVSDDALTSRSVPPLDPPPWRG